MKLGRDPLLVQAASGNTSIKLGGELWIKASGKWLADAGWDEIFVPVDSHTLAARHGKLSPSIETAMHVALPHPVVIHVHSVNAISWAVREDGRTWVTERLAVFCDGPGCPMCLQVSRLPARFNVQCSQNVEVPDVSLLAKSTALVVAADDCDAADSALLAEVERRLEVSPRNAPGPDWTLLAGMARGSGFHAPAESEVHCLATDDFSRSVIAAGTIYPCHGLFLGPATAECDPFEPVSHAVERYERKYGSRPSIIAVRGEGLLVSDALTVTQMKVLGSVSHT